MENPKKGGTLRFKGNITPKDILSSKSKGIKKEDNK